MSHVRLPNSNVELSRVGFGSASLMRLATHRSRRALLDRAIDSGLTHLDAARMYGLGAVESEIGRAIRGRRDAITIATKFGLEAPAKLEPLARFQGPARALLNHAAPIRNAVRGNREKFVAPRRYDAVGATRSLHKSLQQLDVEHVDLLFIHDPGPADEIYVGELVDFFESQKAAGTIRAWGVSQDDHPGMTLVDELGPRAVLQVRNTVFDRLPPSDRDTITFGVLGAPLERILTALGNAQLASRWASRLQSESPAALVADLLLWDALDRNPGGAVLYSTLKASRIEGLAGLVNEPPPTERLAAFRSLVEDITDAT